MEKITHDLIGLEIGHIFSLKEDKVATILTDLPVEEIEIETNDATAFTFELSDKRFTLINTGCGSLAVRTN
ncbi:hypothetical protein OH773_22035 (plasmid) [Buttiauxella sp. WJP83]|uniref:hypothetical protein n=1 Tax=Buttiauxella sp. WJP83 TaxID=2986951 RepID=UPI0022DE68A1|nr:hypothetical protein [Buttiauxella sp. WJP83]WBM73044.1 hypothetical protein OH773_22035 [Buttiauxella sp. WJP83]